MHRTPQVVPPGFGSTSRSTVRTPPKNILAVVSCGLRAGVLMAATAFGLLPLHAQSTGAIQGRVYNPATSQYVRNAEVRLEGTNQITTTENDGSFRFNHVPAGPATITVSYSGYDSATATLAVTPGQTATLELNVQSIRGAPQKPSGEVVQMQAYTVSSEREGNAKAIMEQKNNMNITTSVASDIFGDVTDGSVGEFMSISPGSTSTIPTPRPAGPCSAGWTCNTPRSRSMASGSPAPI